MKISVKTKGIIAAILAVIALLSYVIYYFAYYNYNVRLDELFFIGTGISISGSFGLLFTMFSNKTVKTLTLFCSIFYFILISAYLLNGVIWGEYYAFIKLSLIIGLISGIIYLIHDNIKTGRSSSI